MSPAPANRYTPIPRLDLESRVAERKRELITEIVEYKKTLSRVGSVAGIEVIKARLSELAHIMKAGVADGWTNVRPAAKRRLDEWIAR